MLIIPSHRLPDRAVRLSNGHDAGVLGTRPAVCLPLGMNTEPNMSLLTLEEAAAIEAKHDALRTSAVAETVWAVLMVACLLSLLWSMLGRG